MKLDFEKEMDKKILRIMSKRRKIWQRLLECSLVGAPNSCQHNGPMDSVRCVLCIRGLHCGGVLLLGSQGDLTSSFVTDSLTSGLVVAPQAVDMKG